ncbi:MAG: histidine phosphatase family protein [Phycisphaerae bacterium]|jgi:probable phosphoglycerate mutase
MKLVLIPCAPTQWRRAGRLLGRAELPPSDDVDRALAETAERVRPHGVARILHAPDGLSTAAARRIARSLGVPARRMPALEEVDLGLWTGLTAEQLAQRFPSAQHELCESPLNVTPPDGEPLRSALNRLRAGVQRSVKRSSHPALALVTRPLALALIRTVLEGPEGGGVWQRLGDPDEPVALELDEARFVPTRARIL